MRTFVRRPTASEGQQILLRDRNALRSPHSLAPLFLPRRGETADLDSRHRRRVLSGTDTSRTWSPSRTRRRRDPECQQHERWHESTGLAYRRECAASCPLPSFPRRSPADQSKPPFSALLTLWLSMTAAVGLASRPIASRHFT